MKVAYFDCFSGISGDMILAALVDAGLPADDLRDELGKLPLGDWELKVGKVTRGGLTASRAEVVVSGRQPERRLDEIRQIISSGHLDPDIGGQAVEIFTRLAQAEACIHGIDPAQVHFHEVGAVDALVDVVGALVGLKLLGIDKVFASSLNLGSGTVRCRHGLLPVPAPATLQLLKGVPVTRTGVEAELVTPTGAAIITALAESFGPSPPLRLEAVGYGAGERDLKEMPNLLRVIIGQMEERLEGDRAVVLECNLDDMSPQLCAPLVELVLGQGALDAYLTPVIMKKGRPAVVLTVLAPAERTAEICRAMFRHTTTLGIRSHETERQKLPRRIEQIDTPWGTVRVKVTEFDGRERMMPEYEDCLRVSRDHHLPLSQIYEHIIRTWRKGPGRQR